MIKKEIYLFFILILIFSFIVNAAEDDVDTDSSNLLDDNKLIDKAYKCLENRIKDKTISLEEAIFSTLAIGEKTESKKIIDEQKSTKDCWPKSSCSIKTTSQVALAYERIGKSTADIKKWLLSNSDITKDLLWYLQIDIANHIPAKCDIDSGSGKSQITILDDMTITGNPGSCLRIANLDYWLRIENTCLDKRFKISCDQDFVSSLIYQKQQDGTTYVSSETHSATSLGATYEKVNAKCFKTGNSCDYEGTLWATLALEKMRYENVSEFIPYLLAMSDENSKYFPNSFIHILTGSDDNYASVVEKQKQNKYWDIIGSSYGRFYDTSLAMLSLQTTSSSESESAKQYLLGIQTEDGCWDNNNIRSTGFILYSGFGKDVPRGPGGARSDAESCERAGYSCEIESDCRAAGGNILANYDCTTTFGLCCSIKETEKTCTELGGDECTSNQECSEREVPSAEGTCCLGTCENKRAQNTCEVNGGDCASSCDSSEEKSSFSCTDSEEICCVEKDEPIKPKSNIIWILILGILILLVIIAIIYRTKIQIWWHTFTGRMSSSPVTRGPPPGASPSLMSSNYRRISPRPQIRPSTRRPASQVDKEMEETLKKLKEMSK